MEFTVYTEGGRPTPLKVGDIRKNLPRRGGDRPTPLKVRDKRKNPQEGYNSLLGAHGGCQDCAGEDASIAGAQVSPAGSVGPKRCPPGISSMQVLHAPDLKGEALVPGGHRPASNEAGAETISVSRATENVFSSSHLPFESASPHGRSSFDYGSGIRTDSVR